ncbi:hypothetical protein NDU88_002182 [Pleurodeles waltl]|uniref:Uncharacterized protein n=1 Tax=Pleurodeles waltl TaxID=8319 RepID=A0AAV7M586_PLEWA|nr:hypothetical protein NDU88_002182 [Pleurodeles waltl]
MCLPAFGGTGIQSALLEEEGEASGGRLRHWERAVLELRWVPRGAARIPLRGNPGRISTSFDLRFRGELGRTDWGPIGRAAWGLCFPPTSHVISEVPVGPRPAGSSAAVACCGEGGGATQPAGLRSAEGLDLGDVGMCILVAIPTVVLGRASEREKAPELRTGWLVIVPWDGPGLVLSAARG